MEPTTTMRAKEVNFVSVAMDILEKEMELERYCSSQVIAELIDLYQQAIEYYDLQGDLRYLDYQQRLQKILLRQDVLRELKYASRNGDSSGDSDETDRTPTMSEADAYEQRKAAAELEKKRLAVELSKKTQPIVKGLTRIVETHQSRTKQCVTKTYGDLEAQEDLLERRKLNRRKNKMTNSIVEPQPLNENIANQYQDQLEEIMDQYYSQREAKVSLIRSNYEQQIREMEEEAQGTEGVYKIVIDQMRARMEEEISNAIREMDVKRRASIDRIKRREPITAQQ